MSPFANESLLQAFGESCRNPGVFREKEKAFKLEVRKLRAKTWRSLFDLQESLKCGEITRTELEIFLNALLSEKLSLPKKPKTRRERIKEVKSTEENKDVIFSSNLNYDIQSRETEMLPVLDADMSIVDSFEKIIRPIISKEHRTDFVVVDGKTNIPLGIVSLSMLSNNKDAASVGELPLAARGITVSLSSMKKDALALMDTHNVSTLPVVDDKTGTLFAVLDRGTETQKGVRSGLVLLSTKWALHTLITQESHPKEETSAQV